MTSPSDRIARVRSLLAALTDHDVARAAAHLAAAVTWSRGDGTSVSGRSNLAGRLRDFFSAFPDASLTTTRLLAVEPRSVVVEWVLEGTHLGDFGIPASGRAVRVVGADLLGFNAVGEVESDEARIDVAGLLAQVSGPPSSCPGPEAIRAFAERYTAAWCSQDGARVAAFFQPNGSLTVNAGPPAAGRDAIAASAQGFMTAFPDLKVLLDDLLVHRDRAVYRWTLVGTNTGPGGTGHRVRISGFEVWQIGSDGLVAESRGYFDSAAYQRQIEHGIDDAGQ
jgi:steroid delta-isomerase-like uncharacterized protein/uncharacterized protein (TIGR02246 family)